MLPGAINSVREQQARQKEHTDKRAKEQLIVREVLRMARAKRMCRVLGALLMMVGVVVAFVLLGLTGCSASVPHLVNLSVETTPPADIYFDGLLVGAGSTRIHMFSDLIPNYLEIRDIITGETLSRILLHKIPNLQVLSLKYKSETLRDERIKIIQSLLESENIVNGQTEPRRALDSAVDPEESIGAVSDY